jgi:CRP/FNR family transcriptional regulator, cyclic AMP receptor protein
MENIDIIKNNDLFKDLEENDLILLAGLVKSKKIIKDAFIIKEGETTTEMYLVKKGKVAVILSNPKGKEMVLSTLQQGDIFGELSLLDNKPRSANVIAQENCELLVLHQEDFFEVLQHNPKVAVQVIQYLCQRIRFTNVIAHSLGLMDVYERLRQFLYNKSTPVEGEKLVIKTPLTHNEIALQICSGREMVTRILSELSAGQYLTIQNKQITINKKLPFAR